MTIASCPRCSEQVSVPGSASREAIVRCPFCQDEYSLAEALAQLPPSLIVVSDFGHAPAVADKVDSPWSALNLGEDDADDVALSPIDGDSPAPAFDFTSGSAPAGVKPMTAIRPSSRPRKREPNPIKSLLSIVFGGLMAFPIATLILWYLPGDWKRDVGVGPFVAKYVPQIVPEKFRGSKAKADSATPDSDSTIPDFNPGGSDQSAGFGADESSGSQLPDWPHGDGLGGGGGNSDEKDNANNNPANSTKQNRKKRDTTTVSEEPPAEDKMDLEDAAAVGADLFTSPLEVPEPELGGVPSIEAPVSPTDLPSAIAKVTEEPVPEAPAPADAPPPTVEAPEPDVSTLAPGDIRNPPQVSADDVAKSVEAAASGNLAWDADGTSSPSAPIKREFYSSLSKLGEALTFADRSDEAVAAQIEETAKLLQEIVKQPDKLAVIGGVANGWMAAGYESRKTNGICLAGIVKSVEPSGNVFETTIESAGQQLAVVSMSDPSEYFAADRQVLILGTILDDPAKNLGGYEGSRAVVIVEGYHVAVSTE